MKKGIYITTKEMVRIFRRLPSSLRWDFSKKLKGVLWICESCKKIVDKGKRPRMQFMGEKYCGNCDSLLTNRTPGGQSDSFNYLPIIKTN